ncbi:hypothetical protein AB0E08_35395 [Streptomyces sp. NPDC048281]|uniref:hypothetical protein n=1 Tax=Streptomyces sp. NPDC048281 TaxID=3154715 RepID=UPI003449997C
MGALIAVAVCAVVAGAWGFTANGEWARDAGGAAPERLGIGRGGVDESTVRRLFARLDADGLDAVPGAWALARTALAAGRRVIAIDGKTVRDARAGSSTPHLAAALAHGSGAVPGQVAVSEKSNEIPAGSRFNSSTWTTWSSPWTPCTPSTTRRSWGPGPAVTTS